MLRSLDNRILLGFGLVWPASLHQSPIQHVLKWMGATCTVLGSCLFPVALHQQLSVGDVEYVPESKAPTAAYSWMVAAATCMC